MEPVCVQYTMTRDDLFRWVLLYYWRRKLWRVMLLSLGYGCLMAFIFQRGLSIGQMALVMAGSMLAMMAVIVLFDTLVYFAQILFFQKQRTQSLLSNPIKFTFDSEGFEIEHAGGHGYQKYNLFLGIDFYKRHGLFRAAVP